jgi:hypothetical protein
MPAEARRPDRQQRERQVCAHRAGVAGEVIGEGDDQDAGGPRHVGDARILQAERYRPENREQDQNGREAEQ